MIDGLDVYIIVETGRERSVEIVSCFRIGNRSSKKSPYRLDSYLGDCKLAAICPAIIIPRDMKAPFLLLFGSYCPSL